MEIDECEAQPGYYLTGQVVAAYIQVRLTPQDFGRPPNGIFQDSTSICLLARSPALRGEGRGILDQPDKNEFLNRLSRFDPSGCVRPRLQKRKKGCHSGAILSKFRSLDWQVQGLTLGGASLIKFRSG